MNEELLKQIKDSLPWFVAAAIVVAGYYGVKNYTAARRAAVAESVSNAYTTDELEDAVTKFKGSKAGGLLKLRLAKSYFDGGNFQGALDIYAELDGKAPEGFADVPAVGKAQCLEALGKYDEAQKAFDAYAEANPKSYLTLTARLGAVRSMALAGAKDAALARLEALKKDLAGDEVAKVRIESTEDLVKRYEKRAERSLFEAADAAAKQIDGEKAKAEPVPATPKAE